MISELYVPRERLADFMAAVADEFRANSTNTSSTDDPADRARRGVVPRRGRPTAGRASSSTCACRTGPRGSRARPTDFRGLIDLPAIERGGKYYLTYHRWARRDQVETCHPQFVDFLRAKREHDPDGRFESDWYRHYAAVFADALE